jgi:hypothetical protein
LSDWWSKLLRFPFTSAKWSFNLFFFLNENTSIALERGIHADISSKRLWFERSFLSIVLYNGLDLFFLLEDALAYYIVCVGMGSSRKVIRNKNLWYHHSRVWTDVNCAKSSFAYLFVCITNFSGLPIVHLWVTMCDISLI